ncbi:hypothetical protein [Methylobacterium dankookense]|uniref:Uncharacterized protein n=1 Tax=Methylobacterium dankookense TaxID=560405 RepID=A0A564FU90_9HYPH|nr:hypothetical protein [Methylobacterium dankookense]GJD55303.1 hypothetical protein IFDJLNFL_1187 [Methylobacterium dankookense]VUF11577.1 hypothetical protein MTDSW087_01260 [Methylobacterium dankookense]
MVGIRTAILGSALLAATLTGGAIALMEWQGPGAPVQASPPEPAPPPPAPAPPPEPVPAPAPAPRTDKAPPDATFAAPPSLACGPKAARYEGEKGFQLFVTRAGRAEVENALRPLTPEVTQVLQVTIGSKVATAYGPDLDALRRGGPPSAIEARLGTAIKWQDGLPALPDPLAIVGEDGQPLARLGFRECTEAPPVQAPPPAAIRKDPKEAKPQRNAAKPRDPDAQRAEGEAHPAKAAPKPKPGPKVPPGFTLPQGAIAE